MRTRRILIVLIAVALLGITLYVAWQPAQPPIGASVISLKSNDSTAGYARADRVRALKFPEDHGPHPDFQTEWWYFVGNLDTDDGRHFGYELTYFRRALTPTMSTRESDWATNQVYIAHFAISDVKNNQHFSTERFSRGAAGLAGGSGNPFRVWIENWAVSQVPCPASNPQCAIALDLQAVDGADKQVQLTLVSSKPPALHGDQGLHQKTEQVGNASYYVSFTRLESAGEISVNGEKLSVRGLSWMDHEFSTAVLGADDVGWDWYAFQLSDLREIMFYHIRRKDGSVERLSSGTLVEQDGATTHLTNDDMQVQALGRWQSSFSRATYPAGWHVSIPSARIDISISPWMVDQEMHVSVIYWEGAVRIDGTSHGAPVSGVGFVELTGYATSFVQYGHSMAQ